MKSIIEQNAEKGYIHIGSTKESSLYKKVDDSTGVTLYYLDEGYDCGALVVWSELHGVDILRLILDDMTNYSQEINHLNEKQ